MIGPRLRIVETGQPPAGRCDTRPHGPPPPLFTSTRELFWAGPALCRKLEICDMICSHISRVGHRWQGEGFGFRAVFKAHPFCTFFAAVQRPDPEQQVRHDSRRRQVSVRSEGSEGYRMRSKMLVDRGAGTEVTRAASCARDGSNPILCEPERPDGAIQ
jgi:hypothetical protein